MVKSETIFIARGADMSVAEKTDRILIRDGQSVDVYESSGKLLSQMLIPDMMTHIPFIVSPHADFLLFQRKNHNPFNVSGPMLIGGLSNLNSRYIINQSSAGKYVWTTNAEK
jgi:hypothetical protein